ncbi:MAG TPA: hypothetical protein PJ986_10020 [Gammaproteobacteria bacterium]|nr:hypothetical protein [Gammaproteobacteria bacterium]
MNAAATRADRRDADPAARLCSAARLGLNTRITAYRTRPRAAQI